MGFGGKRIAIFLPSLAGGPPPRNEHTVTRLISRLRAKIERRPWLTAGALAVAALVGPFIDGLRLLSETLGG